MVPAGPLIKLVDLTKRYDAPNGGGIAVLDHVSLAIQQGESLAIVGPSGSGKSTLLQLIGTLDRPTSGQVLLAGRDVGSLTEREVATMRNREIGFVFQAHYLLPQCTVLENVLVPTLAAKRDEKSRPVPHEAGRDAGPPLEEPPTPRALRLLARVGLIDRVSHRPGQLSGGERQRVAVVRALINQPRLLLADEPTGSLDQASAEKLACLLGELNREEKVTLIVATHSRDLAAGLHRILELKNGRLCELGVPPTFQARS